MFKAELGTSRPEIRLVKPDVERDARLGVEWLSPPHGLDTLRMMGVDVREYKPPQLEDEKHRVEDFITKTDQLNWMIQKDGQVIGSIWVDLEDKDSVKAPSVHLMIGDIEARGGGVGSAAFGAVRDWLVDEQGEERIYSRYMTENEASAGMLNTFGFETDGEPYSDESGIQWQNVRFEAVQQDAKS
jgi:RimJ/RimL family protein N-acetyltransferase